MEKIQTVNYKFIPVKKVRSNWSLDLTRTVNKFTSKVKKNRRKKLRTQILCSFTLAKKSTGQIFNISRSLSKKSLLSLKKAPYKVLKKVINLNKWEIILIGFNMKMKWTYKSALIANRPELLICPIVSSFLQLLLILAINQINSLNFDPVGLGLVPVDPRLTNTLLLGLVGKASIESLEKQQISSLLTGLLSVSCAGMGNWGTLTCHNHVAEYLSQYMIVLPLDFSSLCHEPGSSLLWPLVACNTIVNSAYNNERLRLFLMEATNGLLNEKTGMATEYCYSFLLGAMTIFLCAGT